MKKLLICFLISFWVSGVGLRAQIDYDKIPEVTQTILIDNVIIQTNPTDTFGIGDVLIKDGLIEMIAREIEAPLDAKIIKADSMYLYSAFIDGFSYTGVPEAKGNQSEGRGPKFPGFPTDEQAGITPYKQVLDVLKMDNGSIKSMRESGYAIANVSPRGKMLPGASSLILLSGEDEASMILAQNTGIYLQFRGAGRMYPSTVIGVMAKWRDLYKNAYYLAEHTQNFELNPSGMSRPKSDKTLEALVPVVKGMPVFHKTNKVKDIYRALALEKDLDYKLVLTDVKQIGSSLDRIKSSGSQVLLSLDLPKKIEEKEDEDSLSVSERTKAMKARKMESYNTYLSQAATLEDQNVEFGFSCLSAKAKDVRSNIRRMIESGLSGSGALAALTTTPAKMLGIDKIAGSIEKGKMANIIITDKPVFAESSNLKYVFVEGDMTKLKTKKKKEKSGGEKMDIDQKFLGTWSYEVIVFGEAQSGVMNIESDGGSVTIELIDDSTPDDVDTASDIEIDGDNMTYSLSIDGGGQELNVEMNISFSGDQYSGTATIEGIGAFDIKGSKISSPE